MRQDHCYQTFFCCPDDAFATSAYDQDVNWGDTLEIFITLQ